jgi:helicase
LPHLTPPFALALFPEKKRELAAQCIVFRPKHPNLPLLRARVWFHMPSGRLRPTKLWVLSKNKEKPIDPHSFIKWIKKAEYIAIPRRPHLPFLTELKAMLRDYNVSDPIIVRSCKNCATAGRLSMLRKNEVYSVDGEDVCYPCALRELSNRFRSMDIKISKQARSSLETMLKRLRSVDKVAWFLSSRFRPSHNPAITLYDQVPAIEESTEPRLISTLPISPKFVKVLKKHGISSLLPIQILALEAGLLKGKDILAVSDTTSGKSLVGELAGIKTAMEGKTYIYLSPLVALANQKYHEYVDKFEALGLRTAIRVGMSSIDAGGEELVIVDDDVTDANIIVASYEGFDFLLRSGQGHQISEVGVVVIDEIQMVADEDRGAELDGLLARLRTLFPEAQVVALSATVGNPEELAQELKLTPVILRGRPVPLQRHLILTLTEIDKLRMIADISKAEFKQKSSFGFRGQTIVFTNSRRGTHAIATELQKHGIIARPYHAGMTYVQRHKTEEAFANGEIAAVVTTAALAAGVDFPASTVIFQSLMMGTKVLSVGEFTQMLGRAGRLGKHDVGKAILLAEINRRYFGEEPKTEEEVALDVLNNPIEDVRPEATFEQSVDQILATLSCFDTISLPKLQQAYEGLISRTVTLDEGLRFLRKYGLAKKVGEQIEATELGRAAAISYFSASNVAAIREYSHDAAEELSVMLEPLRNVYLSPRLQSEIERAFRTRFATRLFAGAVLDLMSTRSTRRLKKLPRWVLHMFSKWTLTFFNCRCKESPFCDHGQWNLSRKVLEMRFRGLTPSQINARFLKEYELFIYPGDIFGFLDNQVHILQGIERVSETLDRYDLAESAKSVISLIEHPLESDTQSSR